MLDLAVIGLLWTMVGLVFCYAGILAKQASLRSWRVLAWIAGPASLIGFLYALLIDSQRISDGPSFPFPYYGVTCESLGYHFMLWIGLVLVGAWIAFRARRSRKS